MSKNSKFLTNTKTKPKTKPKTKTNTKTKTNKHNISKKKTKRGLSTKPSNILKIIAENRARRVATEQQTEQHRLPSYEEYKTEEKRRKREQQTQKTEQKEPQ